jgi:hypothetical protein
MLRGFGQAAGCSYQLAGLACCILNDNPFLRNVLNEGQHCKVQGCFIAYVCVARPVYTTILYHWVVLLVHAV